MKLDLESIKKIAKSIDENNLSEVTVEINGTKLTMKKESVSQEVNNQVRYVEQPVTTILQEEIVINENISEINEKIDGKEILSPMVGTYYSAPSPDSEDFVKVGDRIEIGDTICIVEAMKMMNEVKSTISGTVISILGSNGKVVKKGDVLFLVK